MILAALAKGRCVPKRPTNRMTSAIRHPEATDLVIAHPCDDARISDIYDSPVFYRSERKMNRAMIRVDG